MPVFQDAASGENKRVFLIRHFYNRDVFKWVELAATARETIREKEWHAGVSIIEDRGLQANLFDAAALRADAEAQRLALECADRLRGCCRVEVDTTGRSFKAQAKSANLRRARFLLAVGEEYSLCVNSLQ